MSVPTLIAIERNDMETLPGGLYARAMLPAYAPEVGCDPEEIVSRFREGGGDSALPFDTLDRIAATANGKHVVERLHSADIDAADHRRSVRNTVLFVLVLLFGGAFYVTGGRIGHIESIKHLAHRATPPVAVESPAPVPTPAPAATTAAAQPATTPAAAAPKSVGTSSDKPVGTAPDKSIGTAPEKVTETTQDKPAANTSDKPAGTTGDKPAGTEPEKPTQPTDPTAVGLRLEIQPRESCWVSATADGQRVIYRMLNAGERTQVEAKDAVDLRIGDPSAVVFTINGAAARVPGTAGEAVSIHLTPQNYREYLSP